MRFLFRASEENQNDATGFGSFDSETCKTVVDLLEADYMQLSANYSDTRGF